MLLDIAYEHLFSIEYTALASAELFRKLVEAHD